MMDKVRKTVWLSEEIKRPPLSRTVRVDDVREGEEHLIEADPAERQAIATLLDLAALDRLSVACRFYPRREGRLVLHGTLAASVAQTCVVSLEPVQSTIEVLVDIEFWPLPLIEELAGSADEAILSATLDWPEPIVDGKIDLGPVIYETFATALDPYPKREGASFEWREAGGEASLGERAAGPFAALARLKPR